MADRWLLIDGNVEQKGSMESYTHHSHVRYECVRQSAIESS